MSKRSKVPTTVEQKLDLLAQLRVAAGRVTGETERKQPDRGRLTARELVDHVGFELMCRRGLEVALALDDDFAGAGFRLLP